MRFAIRFDAVGDDNVRRFDIVFAVPRMDGSTWEPAGEGDGLVIICAPFSGVVFRCTCFV